MKGLIIVNQSIGHNQYKIDRFLPIFKKRNIEVEVIINDGTLAVIDKGEIKINLPKVDFVIYMDKDYYLARMLEKAGYKLFNSAEFTKLCDDKILTYIVCANKNINMVKTLAGPLVYHDNLLDSNLLFLDKVIEELGFPLVVKEVYGSLGEGVHIANNKEELISLYKKYFVKPILFQKYISSSYGKSVRVLIIDGKVVGGFERFNKHDFRSNFGEDASARKLENNSKFFEIAAKISQKLNILYAGLDFLYDENNEPILCEINSNAFFEEFEKVTGIDVATLYIDMIERHVKNE